MKKFYTILFISLLTGMLFAKNNLISKDDFSISDITNLKIELSSHDLYFQTIHGDEISVEVYCNYEKKAPKVSLSNSTLKITSPSNISMAHIVSSVYIYIPDNFKFNQTEINLTSGNVVIENFMASEAYFSLTSGNLKAEYMEIPRTKLRFTSGNSKIEEFRGESLIYEVTSGNIDLYKFNGENLSIEATSADIELEDIDCEYFDIYCTSGTIDVYLTEMIEATSRISSTSGNISLRVPANSNFEVTVDSNSGDFIDKISGRKGNHRDGYYKSYNEGGPAFELITTSGDITLYE